MGVVQKEVPSIRYVISQILTQLEIEWDSTADQKGLNEFYQDGVLRGLSEAMDIVQAFQRAL